MDSTNGFHIHLEYQQSASSKAQLTLTEINAALEVSVTAADNVKTTDIFYVNEQVQHTGGSAVSAVVV